MKQYAGYVITAILGLIGGVLVVPFTQIINPLLTHFECQVHTCETEWSVTRYTGDPHGGVDKVWKAIWKIKPGEEPAIFFESSNSGGEQNPISVTINPLKLNEE